MEPNAAPIPPAEDRLIDAAAMVYASDRGHFRLDHIAAHAGITPEEAADMFDSKAELLRAFYHRAFNRYAVLEGQVPEFGTYSLAEKMATLVFSYADEIAEPQGFAHETLEPLMLHGSAAAAFKALFRDRLAWYIDSDPAVSEVFKPLIGPWLHSVGADVTLYLIRARLADRSPDQERSAALVDKVTTLVQSVLYGGVIDRIWDLGKYLYSQRNV